MPLVKVNAGEDGLTFDEGALRAAVCALPPAAPVVVMLHGYRYAPGDPSHCPHHHILSLTPDQTARRALSWPRHLGLGGDGGLGIAFGWPARGTLWQAYRSAARSGAQMARLIGLLRLIDPLRPIDIVAHSLGARVILSALPMLHPGDVGRMILLAAAEFRSPASAAMTCPAGQAAEVVNVTTRENDLFDFFMETALSAGLAKGIGHGLCKPLANWTDLQIDQPATILALSALGHRIAPPAARICHWSPYLRPGVFPIYRALLSRELSCATLRATLPDTPDARWSRLRPHLRLHHRPLSLPGNPA